MLQVLIKYKNGKADSFLFVCLFSVKSDLVANYLPKYKSWQFNPDKIQPSELSKRLVDLNILGLTMLLKCGTFML